MPIKIGIIRARSSLTGKEKIPKITPPTSYFAEEFIRGNIRMSGIEMDHTLMEIVANAPPPPPMSSLRPP